MTLRVLAGDETMILQYTFQNSNYPLKNGNRNGNGQLVKMAEEKSSVAVGCHCADSEDPFRQDSSTWRCEFAI